MQSGVNAGIDYLTGKPLTEEQKNVIPKLPTSSDIQSQTSKVLGPSYESQTPQGQFASAITQGALGGAAGAGPKVANTIAGALSGAGGEAASKMVPEGSFWQLPAQVLGSLAGGISAIVGGKALQGVRNYSAGNTVGQQIGQQIGGGPVSSGAVSRLGADVAADNLTPAGVAQTAQALGPEARLLDVGRQLEQTGAVGLTRIPGPAQSQMLDMIQGRTGKLLPTGKYEPGTNSAARLNNDFDAAMGPSQDMVALQKQIHDQYHGPTQDAYNKVMGQYDDIGVPDAIKNRPAIESAMAGADELAGNYGATPKRGSLEYWDYVKKSLDGRINSLIRTGTDSQGKADLGGLLTAKRDLVSYLDNATMDQSGQSGYAFARKLSATEKGMEEASGFGKTMFNNQVLPEVAKQQFDDLSIAEQAVAKASIRRELERQMGSVGNDASKAKGLFSQNNVQAKAEAIFGKPAADQIKSAVDRENAFQGVTNLTANSITPKAQQVIGSIQSEAPQIHLGNIVDRTVTGIPQMVVNALHGAGSANTQQGMARILNAQDQNIPAVVKLLQGYNAKRAANEAAPVSSQAQAMIRALLAQGVGR